MFRAKLDPSQLRWQQFWVIKSDGHLVAFGQIRNFHLAQELGSLFVTPAWRNRGLGSVLVQHLITQANQPLYLKCLKHQLVNFYIQRGFVSVNFQDLPPSLKSKFGLSQLRKRLTKAFVLFMKYEIPSERLYIPSIE